MMRWFPPMLGVVLALSPLGCRQYRENWCQEHGFVHANQAPQAAPPPQVYAAPPVYQQQYVPAAYPQVNYGAPPACVPIQSQNGCPPGMVSTAPTGAWR